MMISMVELKMITLMKLINLIWIKRDTKVFRERIFNLRSKYKDIQVDIQLIHSWVGLIPWNQLLKCTIIRVKEIQLILKLMIVRLIVFYLSSLMIICIQNKEITIQMKSFRRSWIRKEHCMLLVPITGLVKERELLLIDIK